jgi:hypothetical protein
MNVRRNISAVARGSLLPGPGSVALSQGVWKNKKNWSKSALSRSFDDGSVFSVWLLSFPRAGRKNNEFPSRNKSKFANGFSDREVLEFVSPTSSCADSRMLDVSPLLWG